MCDQDSLILKTSFGENFSQWLMLLKQLMAKVVDLHPNATTIEDLNAFPFFKMYIPNLKRIKKRTTNLFGYGRLCIKCELAGVVE